MKKIVLPLIIVLSLANSIVAQSPHYTTTNQQPDTLQNWTTNCNSALFDYMSPGQLDQLYVASITLESTITQLGFELIQTGRFSSDKTKKTAYFIGIARYYNCRDGDHTLITQEIKGNISKEMHQKITAAMKLFTNYG